MNKVIYVKAYFAPVGKNVKIKVPTGETKKGLFGGEKEVTRKETRWEQTGFSDKKIDSERLAEDLQIAVSKLNDQGYTITQVTPVISGEYDYKYQAQGVTSSPRILSDGEAVSGGASFGYGYGYSYTDSLIIVAEKNA
ncbi:hypothetical protein [Marinomonas sp. 2405UD68-3]|uniref:hypothetical protein n=1 Tax=Marinomonas sp. 2405UD68-3 TaxID=3391835 RepID=UPI0039C99989